MIFATGDTHGNFRRFQQDTFPEQAEMTRDDYVIICGDFGSAWDACNFKLRSGEPVHQQRLQNTVEGASHPSEHGRQTLPAADLDSLVLAG